MLIGALATLSGTRAAVALMGTAGALAMLAIHLAFAPRAAYPLNSRLFVALSSAFMAVDGAMPSQKIHGE